MPDALSKKADRTLGPSKTLADLSRRVALQTHFQNGTFLFVQPGKQLIYRFAQDGCFNRCGFAAQRFEPRSFVPPHMRRLPCGVPAFGPMIGGSLGALAHSDQSEQSP